MDYWFGLWTLACLGVGWWAGRTSKWQEHIGAPPVISNPITFSTGVTDVEEVLEGRLKPRGLQED